MTKEFDPTKLAIHAHEGAVDFAGRSSIVIELSYDGDTVSQTTIVVPETASPDY